jgi:hypothetical protein
MSGFYRQQEHAAKSAVVAMRMGTGMTMAMVIVIG